MKLVTYLHQQVLNLVLLAMMITVVLLGGTQVSLGSVEGGEPEENALSAFMNTSLQLRFSSQSATNRLILLLPHRPRGSAQVSSWMGKGLC